MERSLKWNEQSDRRILSVTELSEAIRNALEAELDTFWVSGEVSNSRLAPSGHLYFTLKDDQSQIAAVMFRRHNQALKFQVENGAEVICAGRVGLYQARGDLQIYVFAMEPRGTGALALAFEQLKKRLSEEGLFAEERKRRLPFLPRSIGIVTALGGAAVRDILTVIARRFPDRRIVIRSARVQGDGAASEIAEGIRELGRAGNVDVVIVGRGGGSLEDLWAFNEEVVARAICSSDVPVISAVGHEVDFTIADFVADARAPTPTAAAEMVLPEKQALGERIGTLQLRLKRGALHCLEARRERLEHVIRRLSDPTRRLRENEIRLDELTLRLWRRQQDFMERCKSRLKNLADRLDSISPLAVLARGYSIVYRAADGGVVTDASSVRLGDPVRIQFARGKAVCRVEETD